jgi:hypothetical protein
MSLGQEAEKVESATDGRLTVTTIAIPGQRPRDERSRGANNKRKSRIEIASKLS